MAQRLSWQELESLLTEAERQVPKGSLYRHYRDNKGETTYEVVGHAVLESNETIQVLYQSLVLSSPQSSLLSSVPIVFSRTLSEFTETMRGGTQKRFQKL
jgi:hypothetical protein